MAYLRKSGLVPQNTVAHIVGDSHLGAGWTEYETARGRMIVGLPSGGADAGTVGTAYTTAEDKSKSIAHTHTTNAHDHTTPSHQHSTVIHCDGDTLYIGGGPGGVNPFGGTRANFTFSSYFAESGAGASSVAGSTTEAKSAGSTGETALTSNAMSANAAVVTSDLLAYIQLMTIKKD